MKKAAAIFLAVLMLVTMIPMAAFAKVADNDKIIDEILNGDYQHMSYTKDNKYFKWDTITYTVFHADTWGDNISGDAQTAAAKTVLLGVIDKMEAELDNETFEKVLSVLGGASTAAGLIEKANSLTGALEFVESAEWAKSISALNTAIKVLNFANDEYEKYAEAYAIVLSCQAASVYYGDLLDYISANVDDKFIKKAADELKADITKDLDTMTDELLETIAKDAGSDAAILAIEAAMDTNTVTAAIKTGYGVISSIGDKLFNATDSNTYMTTLAAVTRIEDVLPAYVRGKMQGEDELSADFAKIALLTLRESGETMLSNLGKVQFDSLFSKFIKHNDEAAALSRTGALEATKLGVYKDIILADDEYTAYDVFVYDETGKNAIARDNTGRALCNLKNMTPAAMINADGAFYSVYNENLGKYVKVIVTFSPDCVVNLITASSSSSSSSSSKASGGFFAALIQAIKDFFANLFKFKK